MFGFPQTAVHRAFITSVIVLDVNTKTIDCLSVLPENTGTYVKNAVGNKYGIKQKRYLDTSHTHFCTYDRQYW